MDDALTRTGTARGRRLALPTARAFAHMPTALYRVKNPKHQGPHTLVGSTTDRLASRHRSQGAPAHTWIGKDCCCGHKQWARSRRWVPACKVAPFKPCGPGPEAFEELEAQFSEDPGRPEGVTPSAACGRHTSANASSSTTWKSHDLEDQRPSPSTARATSYRAAVRRT